jgi:hypothetical protein
MIYVLQHACRYFSDQVHFATRPLMTKESSDNGLAADGDLRSSCPLLFKVRLHLA